MNYYIDLLDWHSWPIFYFSQTKTLRAQLKAVVYLTINHPNYWSLAHWVRFHTGCFKLLPFSAHLIWSSRQATVMKQLYNNLRNKSCLCTTCWKMLCWMKKRYFLNFRWCCFRVGHSHPGHTLSVKSRRGSDKGIVNNITVHRCWIQFYLDFLLYYFPI